MCVDMHMSFYIYNFFFSIKRIPTEPLAESGDLKLATVLRWPKERHFLSVALALRKCWKELLRELHAARADQ